MKDHTMKFAIGTQMPPLVQKNRKFSEESALLFSLPFCRPVAFAVPLPRAEPHLNGH
jgi:hypothetical protein